MSDHLPYVDVNPQQAHEAVVIWLHGLGDSGNGFAPIVPELKLPADHKIRFVFPHAPIRPITINNGMQMRAWYDIKTLDFNSRADVDGVTDSAAQVQALIDAEIAAGIPSEKIVLAGFSQGGVIALHIATRSETQFAGVLALSTYLCEPDKLSSAKTTTNQQTPFLYCHGQQDEVVPMFLGHAAFQALSANGFPVEWREYVMQHNVCPQEITDVSAWLQKVLLN